MPKVEGGKVYLAYSSEKFQATSGWFMAVEVSKATREGGKPFCPLCCMSSTGTGVVPLEAADSQGSPTLHPSIAPRGSHTVDQLPLKRLPSEPVRLWGDT